MNETYSEICRVFGDHKQESVFESKEFSILNVVSQNGPSQLLDNLTHMLGKESGLRLKQGQNNMQYDAGDFIAEVH